MKLLIITMVATRRAHSEAREAGFLVGLNNYTAKNWGHHCSGAPVSTRSAIPAYGAFWDKRNSMVKYNKYYVDSELNDVIHEEFEHISKYVVILEQVEQ